MHDASSSPASGLKLQAMGSVHPATQPMESMSAETLKDACAVHPSALERLAA